VFCRHLWVTTDLPPFVAAPANGGLSAQVNVVATHFYHTCTEQDVDATLFSRVPQMVQYINYVYQRLRTRSDLASVPLWVTENNVNADYPNPDGTSNCNPTVKFVSDPRGTNPFFAAFRPYVFTQFGKARNQALYHWLYAADTESGEVDLNTGSAYLSYWVDYCLAQMFPSTPTSPGPDILQWSATETSSVEVVATKNSDGSVVLMIVDHAVHAPTDNNGPGDPRTVIADVSSLGTFSSATSITIDAKTNATSGPAAVGITTGQKISVTLGSYGVTFLKVTDRRLSAADTTILVSRTSRSEIICAWCSCRSPNGAVHLLRGESIRPVRLRLFANDRESLGL
jgi:hypothetical protein